MADVLVTCISKPHPDSPHEHIATELGNPNGNWKWSREMVIASIDAKTNTFYTLDPRTGKRADIGVVRPAGRPAYGHALMPTASGPTISWLWINAHAEGNEGKRNEQRSVVCRAAAGRRLRDPPREFRPGK